MKHDWVFSAGMMVVLLLGFLGLYYHSRFGESAGFVKELSHAAMIAGFLGLTVDSYVKERVAKQIVQNVAHYLIGYEQPQEVRDQIRELMGTTIIRRNLEQRYKIVREDQELRLETEFSFYVENFSNSSKDYVPYLAFEEHENPAVVEYRCDSKDTNACFVKKGSEAKLQGADEAGVLEIRGKKINLRPRVEGISYRISGKYLRTVRDEGSDILSFAHPTIGVVVTAEYPPDLEFVSPASSVETEDRWEYNRLFLIGQHIHVRWFKREAVGTQES